MTWVSDPTRTNDELFTVEAILETVRGHNWPFDYADNSFEAQRERARERKLNPAHRPALHHDELQALAERARTLNYFSGAPMGDRPLRNVDALRFFPALENLSVQSSDVADLSPLASLQKLQYLSIAEYADLYGCWPISLSQCGKMPVLARLHLALRHPWPDLRALAEWPALTDIAFNGNLLALEDVQVLPATRNALLKNWLKLEVPLRDCSRLPEMPRVKVLTLHSTASLAGIDRYQTVVNLELAGCFRDLSPLAAMENVTALTLIGEFFHDLQPLTRMPKLRELKFVREFPLDLAILSECPHLRRVEYEHCAMMRTEVAALNAGLLPEALDFAAEQPRPLAALKFYRLEPSPNKPDFFATRRAKWEKARDEFYDGDVAFRAAETRAFCNAMQAKFNELLGPRWGIFQSAFVSLKRYADTIRLPELINAVREYSAQSRFPLEITFVVEPHADMSEELEEMQAREAKVAAPDTDYLMKYYEEKSVLEENEEARRQREERYELLKREHLLRLRGEAEAELAYLAKDETPPSEEEQGTEEPNEASDSEEAGEGGVAIAPPPPAPKDTAQLSDDLMFYLTVFEDCAAANSHWAGRAEYHLGVKFIPWNPEVAHDS